MHETLKEITQISIYLKEKAQKINEVALFYPLDRSSTFNETSKPITGRKWRFTSNISFFRRLTLKIQAFLFKHLPPFIPSERLTAEAKFKTVLAMLLAQEEVRDFFFGDLNRQADFYQALAAAAAMIGYDFSPPSIVLPENPLKISCQLTILNNICLLNDLCELNLQIAALNYQERNEILFRILNQVERPPITSVIEVSGAEAIKAISITTQYAKYKISDYNVDTGEIIYSFADNQATSSIRTQKNSLPNALGTMNQRIVYESETGNWIGSYCGDLSTPFHVLEQTLHVLRQKNKMCQVQLKEFFTKQNPHNISKLPQAIIEKKILFTSLYSWHEIELITDQRKSILDWDQKVIKFSDSYNKLNLFYFNIPFNALNNYPSPAEIKASMQDINDETLIILCAEAWNSLGLYSEELVNIARRISSLKQLTDHYFLKKEKTLLTEIDAFRKHKSALIQQINRVDSSDVAAALKTLLSDKKPDGKMLKGIDKLLYIDYIAKHLGYLHNKNCQNATDRSAGADAADKAQFAYQKIYKKPFLPGQDQDELKSLFEVLYSMYLVWEEPEINTWLSTGFVGEKFYNNFIQKNPETTRYLVKWLKKHPEVYLGLSDYRT